MLLLVATLIIALTIVAGIELVARRTTISIIIRKDPDMASIKERIAALEAKTADHGDTLASVATKDDVAAVASRVDSIDVEIGTDPLPTTAAPPAEPAAEPPVTPAPAASPFA